MALSVESDSVDQEQLTRFFKEASTDIAADFALIDSVADSYREFAITSEAAKYGDRLYLTTHVLRHWLPDVFWATVFGPPYVKLFGKEKLLTAPAFAAEELEGGRIFLQLTPSLKDSMTNSFLQRSTKSRVKEHLGKAAFFDIKLAYDRLAHGAISRVFAVPEFSLPNGAI